MPVTERPLSYVEGLFPNKFSDTKPPRNVEVPNQLYAALRDVAFNPEVPLDMYDIRLPFDKVSQMMIDEEEEEKQQQKIQFLEKDYKLKKQMEQFFDEHRKNKQESRDKARIAAVEKAAADHGMAMSRIQAEDLVRQQNAHDAIMRAFTEHVDPQETAVDLYSLRPDTQSCIC